MLAVDSQTTILIPSDGARTCVPQSSETLPNTSIGQLAAMGPWPSPTSDSAQRCRGR
jgi:hypothetical protein